MVEMHIGAVLERPPGAKYQDTLRFAELAPRAPLPRPKTLGKARSGLPEGFVVALTAPRPCVASKKGSLRMDDELSEQMQWLAEAAAALDAPLLVVPTPSDVRTGPRDRDRLRAYFGALAELAPGRALVWEPSGIWEADEAVRFADALGVSCAIDPLDAAVPVRPITYLRVRGMGTRTRLGEGALVSIADALENLEDAEHVYVSFESERSVKAATRLAQLLEQ